MAVIVAGCGAGGPHVRGQNPAADAATVAVVRAGAPRSLHSVAGVMVQKCPQAGCWFDLRDDTGTLRVDTKNAGFTVLDVPLGTRLTVTGRALGKGPEASLDAVGLRY